MEMDKDLLSIQEVRNCVAKAKAAQAEFATFSQEKVDRITEAIAEACFRNAEPLAKMAVEETGFGRWEDKVVKNVLGSKMTWEYARNMKTVGVLREDEGNGITEIAVPVGVIAALIPSTNPTATVMYKSIISVKAGNAIILSPHPNAKHCILETARIVCEAAKAAGAPDGLISCLSTLSGDGTKALLGHRDIGLILATGGEPMVRAAYSSGNPAIGVGPGNGPAYIEKTADIPKAVKQIIESKTFDNGTICASEQSIVTESCIRDKVICEFRKNGAYFLSEPESRILSGFLQRANGGMNPAIVGKSACTIAQMAGIDVPADTQVLISVQDGQQVGKNNPYTREKLCPVLAFFTESGWESACQRCIQLLSNEGSGHTMTIHSQDEAVIREFGLKKPVSRLLVNTPAALGGVGATTNLAPALTLGCGAVGGSASSDNITPMNLVNIRRVARGVRSLSELRTAVPASSSPSPAPAAQGKSTESVNITAEDVERITREVLAKLNLK